MEKMVFIEKVENFIAAHRVLCPNEQYLVAVSGGADSVVLLHTMMALGYRCTVAHCNFHLRGEESVRDERHVVALCKRLGVDCLVTHFDVPAYEREHGVSTEMACRELRYAWFRRLLAEHNLAAVVVAHHSDDNIETLFLNILRGSGIAGMAAMQPVSGDVRRPLLGVSRHDIEEFAHAIGEEYVTDSSNLESIVKRNRLRNIVLPELRRQFPQADAGILRTIASMQQCNGLYRHFVGELQRDCLHHDGIAVRIDMKRLAARSGDYLASAVFELVRQYGFNSAQAAELAAAAHSPGKRFLSATHTASVGRNSIEIFPSSATAGEEEYILDLPAMLRHGCGCNLPVEIHARLTDASRFSPRSLDGKFSVCFDASIIGCRLVLRHWRKADRFRPFGMRGSRLVSDIFSDLNLSELTKRSLWLLTADDEIVWILSIRSSACHPVGPSSSQCVILSLPHN